MKKKGRRLISISLSLIHTQKTIQNKTKKVQKIGSSNLLFIFYSLLNFLFFILYLYLLKFCCVSDSPFQPFSSSLRFALKKSFKSVFATLLLTRLPVSTFTLCFIWWGVKYVVHNHFHDSPDSDVAGGLCFCHSFFFFFFNYF